MYTCKYFCLYFLIAVDICDQAERQIYVEFWLSEGTENVNLLSFVFQTTLSLCLWPTHLKYLAFIPTLRSVTTHRQPGTCGATWWSFSHRLEKLVLASVGKNSLTRFGFRLLTLNGYAVVVGYIVHFAKALVEHYHIKTSLWVKWVFPYDRNRLLCDRV